MKTFNRNRFKIVSQAYLKQKEILTPAETNKMEPVLMPLRSCFYIDLGANLNNLKNTDTDLEEKLDKNLYWINFDFESNFNLFSVKFKLAFKSIFREKMCHFTT